MDCWIASDKWRKSSRQKLVCLFWRYKSDDEPQSHRHLRDQMHVNVLRWTQTTIVSILFAPVSVSCPHEGSLPISCQQMYTKHRKRQQRLRIYIHSNEIHNVAALIVYWCSAVSSTCFGPLRSETCRADSWASINNQCCYIVYLVGMYIRGASRK